MAGSVVGDGSAALLIDSLRAADREMARAQARRAGLMVVFADARKKADRRRIDELESVGADPRYRPGDAATRGSPATSTS